MRLDPGRSADRLALDAARRDNAGDEEQAVKRREIAGSA